MMEEDSDLYNSDNETFSASDIGSDDDSVDHQFEEVVVGDEEDSHQEIHSSFGGYDYEFVDVVSPSQKCPVCLLTMRDAVQTSGCGHRLCQDCLLGILRSGNRVCPIDRQEIEEEGGFFTDKAWTRDILSLRVKCKHSKRGCDWIGEVRHAEEHQRDCPYEDTACSGCGENIQRRLLETHLDDECPKRIVECAFCQDEFYFIQKQEHEEKYCKRFPLPCKNNCGHKNIPREEMAEHTSEKCLETIVSCSYSSAGCPFQDKRGYLNDHNERASEYHLKLTWDALVSTKRELKDVRQKFEESEENNKGLKTSVETCQAEIRDLTHAVEKLHSVTVNQEEMMKDMKKKIEESLEKSASKVQCSTEMGQMKTQRTSVERETASGEASMRAVGQLNEYGNPLLNPVSLSQSLEGADTSFATQETTVD